MSSNATAVTAASNLTNVVIVDFTGVNLPTSRKFSELVLVTRGINTRVEGSVKGLSSYFKEFRKESKQLREKIDLYRAKGRTFDSDLCHRIINMGEIKPITDGSDRFESLKKDRAEKAGKKYTPFNGVWSAARMQTVFFFVIETTTAKK